MIVAAAVCRLFPLRCERLALKTKPGNGKGNENHNATATRGIDLKCFNEMPSCGPHHPDRPQLVLLPTSSHGSSRKATQRYRAQHVVDAAASEKLTYRTSPFYGTTSGFSCWCGKRDGATSSL